MVEVTLRTVHGRFLLCPGRRLNDIVVGVLGRAQRKYGMTIHALVVLSNHVHLLVTPQSAQQQARFMEYVAGNIAREVGRLHGWREKVWSRRYRSILVSHEEEAQVARLAYILGHGVKEGLVERPQQWPGVHCVRALLFGVPLEGTWFDRTGEYEARRRGQRVARDAFATRESVSLTPLPCWAILEPPVYRERVAAIVRRIVAAGRRQRIGRGVLGKRAILCQDPHDRPLHTDRSPAPAVHAVSGEIRRMLRAAYLLFADAFRAAARRLRQGDRQAQFPPGAFPPPMPLLIPTG
jgi:REP element-mobilizing transposase RayT